MKPGARDPDQDRLLAEIRGIRKLAGASQADALERTFRESLSRCASPASTRIDLDDFGQWLGAAKSTLSSNVAVITRLFNHNAQSELVHLFWDKLDHERAAVAKKAEPTLHTLLSLLTLVAEHNAQGSATQETEGGLSHMAKLLLDRATQDIETRTSLVIYDIMLSVYDARVVLSRYPSLYSDLIHKFSAQIDIPTRRSRVCMKILRSKGERLGLIFDPKAVTAETEQPSAAAWTEWAEFAVTPMRDALLSHDLYKRNSTSVYHLTELFQLAPASVLPLVAALLSHEDTDASLPAILGALRAAKQFGLCRVGTQSEQPLEAVLGKEVLSLAHESHGHPTTQPVIVTPPAILSACVNASIEELQVAALSIVVESRSSIAPLTLDEVSVLHAFLEASFSSTHASGRGSLNALFGRLLTRMSGIGYAAERELTKLQKLGDATQKEMDPHMQAIQSSRAFVQSAARMILESLHPGAPYHIVIAALTFLELMLNSGVDPSFERDPSALKSTFGKFAQDYSLNVPIINEQVVRAILSCADSTYDDIQVRALGILHRFPAPLPGLADRATAERAILFKARQLLLSGRDSESTAAGSLLRVYQQVYIRRLGWMPTSLLHLSDEKSAAQPPAQGASSGTSPELALFADLLTFLEAQIAVAEQQGLLPAAKSNPVHGSLITLQKMLSDADFWNTAADPAFAEQIHAQFLRARHYIDRIWKVTMPILTAAAPEGNSHGEADTADTEVARAIAAAEGSENGIVTESIIRKSQVMLSYSWRGMKEAAALLGKMVSSPLKKGSATAKLVWTEEDIDGVEGRFTWWMTAVRHRGAFSTIYPAYNDAAAAILRCDWPAIKTKPHAWLHTFISKITSVDNRVSTTRRSAGVGYAVLALVAALPLREGREPLDSAVQQLVDAANDCDGKTDEGVIAAHIHAINILRVLVMDSSLAEAMYPHVDTLLSLAIHRFKSPTWYVRNAGLMLFSALSPRVFPARKTNEDDPSTQLPANRFFQMYPTLYPTLKENLEKSLEIGLHKTTNAADAEQAGSLYAVLFLLSRTQAVEHQEATIADLAPLRGLVTRCLSSTDFKIREVAAQAFSALTTASEAAQAVDDLLDGLSGGGENTRHGHLLAVARILAVHGVVQGAEERLHALSREHHSPAVAQTLQTALRNAAGSQKSQEHTGSSSILSLRQCLWDEANDFQIRTDAADELYERFAEVDTAAINLAEEWQSAASLTLSSGRIPLREAVLTLMGHLTGAVVTASANDALGHEFKRRAVTIFSRLTCVCSKETEHVESRLAAVQALAAFGPHLFSPATFEAAGPIFNARIALLDLLQDDDEEVRMIAADLVAKTVSKVSGVASDGSSRDTISDSLLVAARSAVASSTISTNRVWQWMSSTYGLDNDNLWTRYLSTVVLPRKGDIQASMDQALNPSLALFAAERPNMFRDCELDVMRAYRLLLAAGLSAAFTASLIAKRAMQRSRELESSVQLLLDNSDALRFVSGRLVAVRLCLAIDLAEKAGATDQGLSGRRQQLSAALDLAT